ncbi:MAG: hypothetical protein HY885_12235 [Deltaproteobacteria bacterium]|nr:hypothetical protein [Deltaproteobacteria bacterium]
MEIKKIVLGFCLASLPGCASVAEISSGMRTGFDSLFAKTEKERFVPVVYPAELSYPAEGQGRPPEPPLGKDRSADYPDCQFN